MSGELSIDSLPRLLKRQLKKSFGSLDLVPDSLFPFLELVAESYESFDKDRQSMEHAMELVSQEVLQQNQILKDDVQFRRRNVLRLETLIKMDQAILEARSQQETAEFALIGLKELVAFDRASVGVLDPAGSVIEILCALSNEKPNDPAMPNQLPLDQIYFRDKLINNQVYSVADIASLIAPSSIERATLQQGLNSYTVIPMVAGGELIGILNIARKTAGQLSEEDLRVAREIANRLAVLIQHHWLINEVSQLNEYLEERIQQRTQQLASRALEISLLNEMTEMLQACVLTKEAYGIISDRVPMIFPGLSGGLAVMVDEQFVEFKAYWGDEIQPVNEKMDWDDCWALRRNRVHQVNPAEKGYLCPHVAAMVQGDQPPYTLCIPMHSQGRRTGVFFLCQTSLKEQGKLISEGVPGLAQTVSEQISLALSNLRLQEDLRSQAIRDPLTGLYNRRYMLEALGQEITRAARSGNKVGVIMLDLDLFKQYNDRFGHMIGDRLLEALGSLIQRQVRASDIACRYGGEEFVLIMPDADVEVTRQRAEHLSDMFPQISQISIIELPDSVTCSAGVAVYPKHGGTPAEILQAADKALYQAKQSGRNRVQVAESLNQDK